MGRGMRTWRTWETEYRSATLALTPMMLAERDREYLKQCRRNRDAEAKLMANEEGWEVGTWYGHPIYKTTGDKWIDVTFDEFYAHCDKEQKNKAKSDQLAEVGLVGSCPLLVPGHWSVPTYQECSHIYAKR